MRKRPATVECYDCHQQVPDLKAHRNVCPNSQRNKSVIKEGTRGNQGDHHAPQKNLGVTVFALIDVSGSMTGNRLAAAKEAVTAFFATMEDNDRFSIVSFDSNAYFKLKPRPVGQLRRQNELPGILKDIFAQGSTALYDAIYMTITQLHSKEAPTAIVVLTDGEDNASKHTLAQIEQLLQPCPNIKLSIVHVDDRGALGTIQAYADLCKTRGEYTIIKETQIIEVVTRIYVTSYRAIKK